jgi:predicted DNA-binding transcriptional regulator AlpA
MSTPTSLEPLLSIVDLTTILNVGRRTLERMLASGEFPSADLRIGKMPRWRQSTVADWIAKGGAS